MEVEIKTEIRMAKDDWRKFLVTSHEGTNNTLTIHGSDIPVSINMSKEQAEGLIERLSEAVGRLGDETN